MSIGQNIKYYRKNMNLSQESLSKLANISRSHLANIEIGKDNPSINLLNVIAYCLKVNTSDLMSDTPKNIKDNNKNRLKFLREKNKYTLEQIAEFLNDTIQNIVMYESNMKQPDYSKLKRLSEFYNVTIEYLMGEINLPKSINNNDNHSIDSNAIIIMQKGGHGKNIIKLTDDESTMICAMLEALRKNKNQ